MPDGSTRCRAGETCRDGETVHDPATGERVERLGAIIEAGVLCERCTNAVDYAIRSATRDVRDLAKLLPPSLTPRLRDPELPEQPRIKKAPPLPMNARAWSVMELYVYEAQVWAESVAEHVGIEFDSYAVEHMLWPRRVEVSAAVLEANLSALLGLQGVEHRARSTHADPETGHDEDRVIVSAGGDTWTTRDGWEGALTLLRLHQDTERLCGRHPGNRVPLPCSKCHTRALVREHHNNRIICRFCGDTESDADFSSFLSGALQSLGKPRVDDYEQPDDGPPVPVGRGGTPSRYVVNETLPFHGPFLPDNECPRSGLPTSMCDCCRGEAV